MCTPMHHQSAMDALALRRPRYSSYPICFFIRSICQCHRIEGICGRFGCSCMDSKLPEREQCQVPINLELSEIIPERIQFLIMRLSTFPCSLGLSSRTSAIVPPHMIRVFRTLQYHFATVISRYSTTSVTALFPHINQPQPTAPAQRTG